MQKTITYALFLLLVTGAFAACERIEEEVVVEDEAVLEEVVVEEERVIEEEAEEEITSVEEPEDDSVYDDGTYTETGSYTSPNGPETIGVTLTIQDDTVTAVSIRKDATNEKSINFQTLFAAGISAEVVGKNLDEIGPFTSVNGSSLTPQGFALALAAIKADAAN